MELTSDAICSTSSSNTLNFIKYFSTGRIMEDILHELIQDLDEMEIISIIFLMTDINTNLSKLIECLDKDIYSTFFELNTKENWAEKLLEILTIIKNFNIIKKLGYNVNEIEEMKKRFLYREHNVALNINRVIKSLYFLCDNLKIDKVKKLTFEVNKHLDEAINLNGNKLWLEIYILHWLQKKYISINEDSPNLNNLINNLKHVGCLCDLPFNIEYWKKENVEDSIQCIESYNSTQCINYKQDSQIYDSSRTPWSENHKKLCVIINIIEFKNKNMYRIGSRFDEKRLEDTFKGCGFEIKLKENFTKQEMISFLNSLNESIYSNYGAIFICILSHGFEGEVIFSDCESIPIKLIEEKICCKNLQNTFKFIILQSCQNKRIEDKLTTDGSEMFINGLLPLYYKHFVLFQATINNFFAIRDESKGSWFIQDICNVIQSSQKPMKVTEFILEVTNCVSNRREKFKGADVAQVPGNFSSMTVDYILPAYNKELINKT